VIFSPFSRIFGKEEFYTTMGSDDTCTTCGAQSGDCDCSMGDEDTDDADDDMMGEEEDDDTDDM
jgi:hypothetical protein